MLHTMQQFLVALDPGFVWAGAILGAMAYAVSTARRESLDTRAVYWACVLAIVFGLWGGHLLGIFYYGTDGRPWAWLRFWSGGQAQYGGLIAGATAVLLFLKICKMSLLTYADVIAPGVALAVAIGRIGCFLNGDDFGSLSRLPWAVQFPPGTEAYADHLTRGWIVPTDAFSLPVHPVQLYATLAWLGFFVVLVVYRPDRPGLRLALFACLQGIGRFVEQYFRGDFQPVLGPLSLTQLISLFFIAAGIGVWLSQRNKRHAGEPASTGYLSTQGEFKPTF
jgi:phosphatidylglycerol---prolipoprotein diacylglyceryl transferase